MINFKIYKPNDDILYTRPWSWYLQGDNLTGWVEFNVTLVDVCVVYIDFKNKNKKNKKK